eukprot:CAMPEP_0178419844 /NCGR_PEP_ID=MMETSP0689_2-20121128/25821_1 /TAXON_ID=160604 /ORGANISM="Amphidinium massartii, Strain CS-259" /LENGTH=106 /DNA_ID=CAMNT_0020041297 /DNA_START=84 /DNA_END=404 /DNA_ORIENTATION=-
MAGSRTTRPNMLAALICLGACSFLLSSSITFLSAPSQQLRGSSANLQMAGSVAAPAALLMPTMAGAEEMIPEPVLGIGMLSVIVVLVLIISAFAIGRGLVETIDDI